MRRIPIYFINGFLESGKTQFLNYTLNQSYFLDGSKTLVIACEEGIEEYDEKDLNGKNIVVEYLDEESDFNSETFMAFDKKHKPERIIIEYNGMWNINSYVNAKFPAGWKQEQWITTIDASTFENYLNNMKSLIIPMVSGAEMVIFNRCTEDMPLEKYRRALKATNRNADYIFEGKDGEINSVFEEDLPYDINADVLEITEDAYMIFFIDAMDRPDRYDGKTIHYLGHVLKDPSFPKDVISPGRQVMTCCADDVQFAGYVCKTDMAPKLNNSDWIDITATIKYENSGLYNGVGPVLYAKEIKPAKKPKQVVLGMN